MINNNNNNNKTINISPLLHEVQRDYEVRTLASLELEVGYSYHS